MILLKKEGKEGRHVLKSHLDAQSKKKSLGMNQIFPPAVFKPQGLYLLHCVILYRQHEEDVVVDVYETHLHRPEIHLI